MTIRLRPAQPWHIQVAPYRDGWIVGEAALDNAQFFHARADAEAAASNLGERLGHAGEFCEISVRLPDGETGGHFIITKNDGSRWNNHDRQNR